jgi:hypothetical protein
VPEAKRPNGRVAEGRAARTRGGALTTLLGEDSFSNFQFSLKNDDNNNYSTLLL